MFNKFHPSFYSMYFSFSLKKNKKKSYVRKPITTNQKLVVVLTLVYAYKENISLSFLDNYQCVINQTFFLSLINFISYISVFGQRQRKGEQSRVEQSERDGDGDGIQQISSQLWSLTFVYVYGENISFSFLNNNNKCN